MGKARHRFHHAPPPTPEQQGEWPQVDDELLKALSSGLRGVVRALGYSRATEWLREYGGLTSHLPLVRTHALGLAPDELARLRVALAHHIMHDGRVWIPKADKLLLRVRNAHMRSERAQKTEREMARQYRLSDRQIRNICRDDEEPGLFD